MGDFYLLQATSLSTRLLEGSRMKRKGLSRRTILLIIIVDLLILLLLWWSGFVQVCLQNCR